MVWDCWIWFGTARFGFGLLGLVSERCVVWRVSGMGGWMLRFWGLGVSKVGAWDGIRDSGWDLGLDFGLALEFELDGWCGCGVKSRWLVS